MEKLVRFTILKVFIVSLFISGCKQQQHTGITDAGAQAQPVYSIVRQMQDFEWYETQAKAWKKEIDNGTTNTMAWVYWHEANRMAAYFCDRNDEWKSKIGDYFIPIDSILKLAEKRIPNTFEYYFLKSQEMKIYEDFEYWTLKAQEIRPYDNLLLSNLLMNYLFKNDEESIERVCKKWFESNEIPQDILITLYNMLISLEENAILLVHGDNDTFPCWVLQNAINIRPDVLVLNISLAGGMPSYRKNIFEENGIKPLNNESDSTYLMPQQLFKYLVENKKERPLYVSAFVSSEIYKEYDNNVYMTGLAFKYSPEPFNNLLTIRDNIENKFLLDFLKQRFHNTYAQSVVNRMNGGYLPAFRQLYNHYKQVGEKDKAKQIKELARVVAQDSERMEEWLNYFKE